MGQLANKIDLATLMHRHRSGIVAGIALAHLNRSPESVPDSQSASVPELLSATQWSRIVCALKLSPREAEIVGCAFYDERDCAIALCLGISEHTVHTHRVRVFRKLGVRTTAQVFATILTAHLVLSATSDLVR